MSEAQRADTTGGATILLVEDDVDTADLYATYLNSTGYGVTVAQTEEEACCAYDDIRHDVVITDLGLPGRSARAQVIEHVTERSGGQIPVIIVTGHDQSSVPHSLASQVVNILVKPVLPDELEQEVRRTLERSYRACERARAAQRRIPSLLARSVRLSAQSLEIRARARDALVEGTCPACSHPLVPVRNPVRPASYAYFEPCPHGCGRFFRDPATSRYYRLP
jgi:DNA-binding response OmpR family regulator